MKYALAGIAVLAAVAALFFRPSHGDSAATPATIAAPPPAGATAPSVQSLGMSPDARAPAPERSPLSLVRESGTGNAARPSVVVYVAGEVIKPGVYELPAGTRAQAALARAGGPKPDADLVAVNLAAPVDDGTEIVFPKIGEASTRAGRAAHPRGRSGKAPRGHGRVRRAKPRTAPSASVDLNSADANELETVPGLGPALAARIVAYREANGPFASLDELADVSGITPSLQEKLAEFIVIR